jgi:hypothetical protein
MNLIGRIAAAFTVVGFCPHRFDVVAARHGDAILSALKLGLLA